MSTYTGTKEHPSFHPFYVCVCVCVCVCLCVCVCICLSIYLSIYLAKDKRVYQENVLYFPENVCCGYSLVPQ